MVGYFFVGVYIIYLSEQIAIEQLHNGRGKIGRPSLEKDIFTRKYPLRGYFLGVLTHTTAWDRHWERDCNDDIMYIPLCKMLVLREKYLKV